MSLCRKTCTFYCMKQTKMLVNKKSQFQTEICWFWENAMAWPKEFFQECSHVHFVTFEINAIKK